MTLKTFFFSAVAFTSLRAEAQGYFHLTAGAYLNFSGHGNFFLSNTNLVIDGTFHQQLNQGQRVVFMGNTPASISGNAIPYFDELNIETDPGDTVSLLRSIHVVTSLRFRSGLLDMRNSSIWLDSTGRALESITSHLISSGGGTIIAIANLNAPSEADPGNLGAIISSSENLGLTTVARGQRPIPVGGPGTSSIQQYFDIRPSNDTNLQATLTQRFLYSELNGFSRFDLNVWMSKDGVRWTNLGLQSAALNTVTISGINSFSKWTLSSPTAAVLPIAYAFFQAHCASDQVDLNWATTQESNSKEFKIQRSAEGSFWQVIGSLPAAGDRSVKTDYSFTDPDPAPGIGFYRLMESDLDNRVSYSKIVTASCSLNTDGLTIGPNPLTSATYVHITSSANAKAIIRVYDARGNQVWVKEQPVVAGINNISLDLGNLAAGSYAISADWGVSQHASATILKL